MSADQEDGNSVGGSVLPDTVWFPGGFRIVPTIPPTFTSTGQYLCPDLLGYEQIGAADHLRGRVVRAFFRVMRWWPVPRDCRGTHH